ncbi:DUF3298 and DUF4163 domain-containing protein [Luteimonas sp. MC1825]|uniref:DUF3298 and DUF4163 domain-containing protein n=1 Tax=Luteimonas sp. MC1825 TaxID=2761107 RepID=UPI001614E822|nr:DUF3298 and DUF4163 domain-containing protein [Luteimonas sp. MC1825]MBB6598989.1 hypothetical protein [Luteimonas sp. MC1825]QOC89127.1 hypothetical protein IDM46_05220 [Luteimonas sp. MC1825]
MKRLLFCVLLLVLAGCRREADVPGGSGAVAPAPGGAATPAAAGAEVPLVDVMESTSGYIIGISYPPGAARYPGLASALKAYADSARGDLMDAVATAGEGGEGMPYDLSLPFDIVLDTPQLVAVKAEGTSYTGGAHGTPLVARFVWLPERQELLSAQALIPDPAGWRDVSAFVRESLHAALSQRIDADELEPVERARLLRSIGRMIDDGTEPQPANFAAFEPVPGPDGRLRALRFVFPPYQVGPYSDGVQTVEVPASLLLPHVAPAYRGLFAAG